MDRITAAFPDAQDYGNVSKKRWRKQQQVLFDTFTLLTSIIIRFSGDGLTSVGNYVINWTMDKTIDAIAETIFTMYDWSTCALEQVLEALIHLIHDKDFIKRVLNEVREKAKYTAETGRRESTGQKTKKPESEFIAGEGDDKIKEWSFIKKFEVADAKDANARIVLGAVTFFLYAAAGMNLEPQDRQDRTG